jgi:hypothetical protein
VNDSQFIDSVRARRARAFDLLVFEVLFGMRAGATSVSVGVQFIHRVCLPIRRLAVIRITPGTQASLASETIVPQIGISVAVMSRKRSVSLRLQFSSRHSAFQPSEAAVARGRVGLPVAREPLWQNGVRAKVTEESMDEHAVSTARY